MTNWKVLLIFWVVLALFGLGLAALVMFTIHGYWQPIAWAFCVSFAFVFPGVVGFLIGKNAQGKSKD